MSVYIGIKTHIENNGRKYRVYFSREYSEFAYRSLNTGAIVAAFKLKAIK